MFSILKLTEIGEGFFQLCIIGPNISSYEADKLCIKILSVSCIRWMLSLNYIPPEKLKRVRGVIQQFRS